MRKVSLAVEGRRIAFSHDRKGKSMTLNGLDISVPRGHVYGLLGPSGCGKTTLLRCIVGRLRPTKGTLRVYGRVPGESGFCIPGRGVGYMPQELALYLDITIEETLTYFGRLFHMDYSQIAERISFLTKLLEIPEKNSLIKNLSGGQQRRVSFAVALMHKPPLLILDEPTVGVDPLLRQSVWDHLVTLASTDHLTIIITTHYVEEARLAHVVGLMRDGCLLAERNPEKLIEHYEVRTLEEVFLKLCRKTAQSNSNLVSMEPLMSALDKVASDYDTDVWVPQEALDKQENRILSEKASFEALDGIDVGNCNQLGAANPEDLFNLKDIFDKPTISERFIAGFHRTNTLIVKSFIRWRRNLPLAIFHLLSPIIQIIIFCLFIGRDPTDLDLAVVNLETESYGFSHEFLKNINNQTIIQRPYPNLTLAVESVKLGQAWGVLYIGPHFSTAMMDRFLEGSNVENETIENSAIKLFLDMSNQLVYSTIFATVNKGFHDFAVSSLESTHQNPRLADAPVIVGDPIYGKKDTSFTEFLVSGMMLSVINFMAMGLTSLTIVLERKEGMLDRAAVAGVSFCEVVFSILFSMFIMMTLQVTLVVIIVLVIFAIPVEGSVFWLFFCAVLGGITGMATGIFVSSVSDNENQASVYVLGCFTPTFMLCGILWPVEAMGHYLRYFSYSLPLTLLADTMRSILSRGWSIVDNNAWGGPVISTLWTVSLIMLSMVVFKFRN